ncbi:MAG: type I CRISPR-associated protein Cas7 [Eubacteriales bacterium]|nr:type I CRISPR-associated protein Cas7 [Eubacteriales bacterium]
MEQTALHRGTGLLWIEAVNSNPNGDPDQASDPRIRQDKHGVISAVSLKHKIRQLIAYKEGALWQEISEELGIEEKDWNHYDILEQKETSRVAVKKLAPDEFLYRFWDARVFGTTFLENKEDGSFIHTGVAQFGLGISLSPVEIERMTTTKEMPAEEGKGKGMAPLAYRIVPYGLYMMPFFINATMAGKTRCSALDIELLLRILPYAYQETASYMRAQVNIRHAYYVEHRRARGGYSDFKILEALTPKSLLNDAEEPAKSIADYDTEAVERRILQLNQQMDQKAGPVRDLVES